MYGKELIGLYNPVTRKVITETDGRGDKTQSGPIETVNRCV
jgi:hypothetical protein